MTTTGKRKGSRQANTFLAGGVPTGEPALIGEFLPSAITAPATARHYRSGDRCRCGDRYRSGDRYRCDDRPPLPLRRPLPPS
jgi:hypothetical protein